MRHSALPDDERLLDLLVERTTQGLSDSDASELRRAEPGLAAAVADEIALAAAEADRVFARAAGDRPEPMPEELGGRILAAADRFSASDGSARGEEPDGGQVIDLAAHRDRPPQRSGRPVSMTGWYVAAAILALALFGFWARLPEEPPAVPTAAELRQQLLDAAADAVQVAWNPPDDARFGAVEGDVVWSDSLQTGFMRLRGMPVNQPTLEQYQLWIVDPERDTRPVDGGVFDVPAGDGEIVVPIDAKLAVKGPTVFAITLEQPGGVVVSDGPLLVIATVQG